MNILSPFNQLELLDMMIEKGVSEFYMGFYDPEWNREYGNYSDINRLSLFKESANRYQRKDMESITKSIHESNGTLFMTFNAPIYYEKQLIKIEEYLEELGSYGVDGIITAGLPLIPLIHKYNMRAVASTMCGIYNSEMAKAYQDNGIDRIIFPREMSLKEIESVICKVPDMSYEVFLMRNGCKYADSHCLGLHGGNCGAFCSSIRNGKTEYVSDAEGEAVKDILLNNHNIYNQYYHEFACGQCAIYRLLQLGIDAVKIVGRLDDMKEIAADVDITSKNIAIASTCTSEYEYLEKMVMPGEIAMFCRHGLSCYYPEIRFASN